jgi:hypothetical protein
MCGHPNHVTTLLNRNRTIVSVFQSVIGVASAHQVKYYVTVIMYLTHDLLVDGLIDPTKSIAHLSNACNVTYGCKGISTLLDGFPTL